jgi:dihydrofolate reductase
MSISMIAAIGNNYELGKHNQLLWDLPADMQHFRSITSGHPVIMGERTFRSLFTNDNGEQVGKPLPRRRNIIITLDKEYRPEGAEVVFSIDEALDICNKEPNTEFFIIGGGMIYKQMIDKSDRLYITHVNVDVSDADVYFPAIDSDKWQKITEEKHNADEKNNLPYSFVTYIKKSA